jgi:hypothetical protein
LTDTLNFLDIIQLAVPFFIVTILAEHGWIAWKGKSGRYETRDAIISLVMEASSVTSGILLGFPAWGFSCGFGR